MSDIEWVSSFLWPFKNPTHPDMGVLASWGFPHSHDCSVKFSLSLSFGYLHWKCWKLGIFLCGLFCTKMIHLYYLIQANIRKYSHPIMEAAHPFTLAWRSCVFYTCHNMLFTHDSLILVAFLEIDLVTTYFPDGGAWWIKNFQLSHLSSQVWDTFMGQRIFKGGIGLLPF